MIYIKVLYIYSCIIWLVWHSLTSMRGCAATYRPPHAGGVLGRRAASSLLPKWELMIKLCTRRMRSEGSDDDEGDDDDDVNSVGAGAAA